MFHIGWLRVILPFTLRSSEEVDASPRTARAVGDVVVVPAQSVLLGD
jgi:hypothetical protein